MRGPRLVVLVNDAGRRLDTTARAGVREGQVYCWNGRRWSRAAAEERRRLRAARDILDSLKRSDPGGNITL